MRIEARRKPGIGGGDLRWCQLEGGSCRWVRDKRRNMLTKPIIGQRNTLAKSAYTNLNNVDVRCWLPKAMIPLVRFPDPLWTVSWGTWLWYPPPRTPVLLNSQCNLLDLIWINILGCTGPSTCLFCASDELDRLFLNWLYDNMMFWSPTILVSNQLSTCVRVGATFTKMNYTYEAFIKHSQLWWYLRRL